MLYQLKNEHLSAGISSHGAELVSLKRNQDGKEYMWQGDPAFWGRTSPVLFPFVGALRNGAYRYEGKTYTMGQHGFARDREFKMIRQSASQIVFRLMADDAIRAVYPFDFALEISYILEEKELHIHWRVSNQGTNTMHFSIGAHPAFLYPDGQKPYLIFDSQTLSYRLLEQGLTAPDYYRLPLEHGRYQVRKDTFDRDALIVEGGQNHSVKLADASGQPYLQVVFDSPLYALWSPAGKEAPFLCIEPWWGRCDRVDFEGTLEDREYSNAIAPGAVFNAGYYVEILE